MLNLAVCEQNRMQTTLDMENLKRPFYDAPSLRVVRAQVTRAILGLSGIYGERPDYGDPIVDTWDDDND